LNGNIRFEMNSGRFLKFREYFYRVKACLFSAAHSLHESSMKSLLCSVSVVVLLGGLSGCGKNDAPAPSNVFTAQIDGVDFTADEIEGVVWADDDVDVVGYTDNQNGFMIFFKKDEIEEGETYDLEGTRILITYVHDDDNTYYPSIGEMHVIKLTDTRFEATFEFDGEDYSGGELVVKGGVVKTDLEVED
jgi:hypothetical protein